MSNEIECWKEYLYERSDPGRYKNAGQAKKAGQANEIELNEFKYNEQEDPGQGHLKYEYIIEI